MLARARAEGCEFEYEQVAFAYRALIEPHIDWRLERKIHGVPWLPVATSRPHHHFEVGPAPLAPVHQPVR